MAKCLDRIEDRQNLVQSAQCVTESRARHLKAKSKERLEKFGVNSRYFNIKRFSSATSFLQELDETTEIQSIRFIPTNCELY